MRIDYYGLRAKEYDYLRRFISQRKNDKKPNVAELLPNFLMSSAMCKRHLVKEESKANERIEASWIAVCKGITEGNLQITLDSELPEANVMLALLLYPSMLRDLLEKIAKKQISQVFKKSWYIGYQA